MASSPVKQFLLSMMPEKCYEEVFVRFHSHVPCLKFILNKVFGIWILLDALLAPLPQLLKILCSGSASGLSLTSVLLQLYAASCPVAFAAAKGFPLFSWGERLLVLAQLAAIVFLILRYRDETRKGMLFLLAYSGIMVALGCNAAPKVMSAMKESSLAALIASKGVQAAANYGHGHTGQLSGPSVFLSLTASLGSLLLALQDTGSPFTLLCRVVSAALSCVLLAQILCCSGGELLRWRRWRISKQKHYL